MGDERGLVGYHRDILGRFLACVIGKTVVPFGDRKRCRKDVWRGSS